MYLLLSDNLVGTHIKSIAKYTAGDSLDSSGKGGKGGDDRLGNLQSEIPSEETIHHVLAYLSSITRPSKVAGIGECETPRSGTVSSVSRQPTVKFSPNTLMIPADRKFVDLPSSLQISTGLRYLALTGLEISLQN